MKPFIYDKDRDEEMRERKPNPRKKFEKKPQRVHKDSLLWLEHAEALRKAGIDVYEADRKTMRQLR